MNLITVESEQRFSKSILWALQSEYFEKEGISAWDGQVPFYITSNPFIADQYAQLFIRNIQDHLSAGKLDLSQPIVILELGTGSGQFSFHCLRRLQHYRAQLDLAELDICYVMTDFTEANIGFWEQHEQLQPFVSSGLLDYAEFNLESPKEIQLKHRKLVLSQLENPLMVVANYIFDTVNHDIFYTKNQELFETFITVKATPDNVENNRPKSLKHLTTEFTHYPIQSDRYYEDAQLNAILKHYQEHLNEGSFLFPIGSFKAIQYLRSITKAGLMIISTDKAYTHLFELENRRPPKVTFHGSISMTVNFHAIQQYCELNQGKAFFPPQSESIRTGVFFLDTLISDQRETELAIQQAMRFSAGDYFRLHRTGREIKPFNLTLVHSQLHLALWDPYVVHTHIKNLNTEVPKSDARIAEGFNEGLKIAGESIYSMPGMSDQYFSIAMLLHTLEDYDAALPYYLKSLEQFGSKFPNHYNLGICYHMLEDDQKATKHFQQARTLEKGTLQAEKWLKKIRA